MRVVLDTGVVLSSLLFPGGRLNWLPEAWKEGLILPLVCRETTEELLRALAYPKFGLAEPEIQLLLGDYLPWTTTVVLPAVAAGELPSCRDPHDQVFLWLAAAGGVEALVSGDRALLALAPQAPFRILAPAELRRSLP